MIPEPDFKVFFFQRAKLYLQMLKSVVYRNQYIFGLSVEI